MNVLPVLALFAGLVSAEPPRLLVVVSVDQMRAEFLERAAPGGALDRLKKGGAVFTEALHRHAPTETCPGHAVILTGAYPAENGIVANDWLDRRTAKLSYCAFDPLFGLSPRNLRVYTLGDALKAKKPEARVFAVSVKDRAAIMLGGQRPDGALWFDKEAGEFATSGYYTRPDWLEGFNRGLRARRAPLFEVTADSYTAVAESTTGDELVLLAALELLRREKLGRDEVPDILAVSFSGTDYVGHAYGADGAEMAVHLAELDKKLGRLLAALDRKPGVGRWALALTADHGSTPTPWSARGKELRLRHLEYAELERRLEAALQYQYPSKEKWLTAEMVPHIWLSTQAAASAGMPRAEFLRNAAKIVSTVEDVAAVYIPEEPGGGDPYAAVVARSVDADRRGDLLIRLKPDIALTEDHYGNHGSFSELDSHVPLVFYGAGFAPGVHDEKVGIVDLAPTAAAVLGVPFTGGAEARRLSAALAK